MGNSMQIEWGHVIQFCKFYFFRFSVAYKKMARSENLPDVISEFLKAIDEMSNTVLVPHRLVDIPKDSPFPAGKCQCATTTESSLVEPAKELNDSGLYGTYHMLLDIKEELTTGKKTSAEGCFRSHVKVVVESMKYLTWLAKSLTQNYCEEVGSGGEADTLQKNRFWALCFSENMQVKRNELRTQIWELHKPGDM